MRVEAIRAQVGDARVILGLSGGVDSSVVAALCAKAIGKQLTCVFVNHGLLRKDEPEEVEAVFTKQFDVDFVHVHAEDRYAALLADVVEPEEKRHIIGSQFWEEFFAVAQDLAEGGRPVKFLAQGTIYPDIIESGARKTGRQGVHHQEPPQPDPVPRRRFVRTDRAARPLLQGRGARSGNGAGAARPHRAPPALPRARFGHPHHRHRDARQAGHPEGGRRHRPRRAGRVQRDLRAEDRVWQYFAVLPDIKSVGVMGDERTYGYPVILRAVESSDAMTADWAKLPYDVLGRISSRIVAEVPGVNRVAYDVTSKPPATIEWE